MDVMPSILYLSGLELPAEIDGTVLGGALTANHLLARPIRTFQGTNTLSRDRGSPYSEAEQAQIEKSLRGLGYL
jgi:hypothetical protein